MWILKVVEWLFGILNVVELAVLYYAMVAIPVLCFARSLREHGGAGLVLGSMALAAQMWCACFLYVHQEGGWFWLIAGTVFFGVGVFPLAVVFSMIHGHWSEFWSLLTNVGFIVVIRCAGVWFVGRAEEARETANRFAQSAFD